MVTFVMVRALMVGKKLAKAIAALAVMADLSEIPLEPLFRLMALTELAVEDGQKEERGAGASPLVPKQRGSHEWEAACRRDMKVRPSV